jgi:hypothetical protein
MKKIILLLPLTFLCLSSLAQSQTAAQPAQPPGPPLLAGARIPQWPALSVPLLEPGLPTVRSHDLEILHAKNALGGFIVRFSERTIAVGSAPTLIGYVTKGDLRWLNCAGASLQKQSVSAELNAIRVEYDCKDPDGGSWHVDRLFRPAAIADAIEVQTDIAVDQDRAVAFLPVFLLFPGVASFGEVKGQGLFAGLEYLQNEPSSSEADVIGPAAKRQVPDSLKITFPLLAIQHGDRYVAMTWQMRPFFSALFDSPDRLFHSGGHVMGVLFPGSDGQNRDDGSLLPRVTELLHARQNVSSRAIVLGGMGKSVVPAVQQFVKLRRLPPVPGAPGLPDYVSLAAGGWLDSKIREGNLIRHALAGGSFKPQPAADAALWMEWLAGHDSDSLRAAHLREAATNLLSVVPAENLNFAGVGHVRYPAESLIFGHVAENAAHAEQAAKALLSSFEPDGSVKYHAKPGGPDFAKTHFTNEASGLTSRVVLDLLEAATFSGNRELLDLALQRLRDLDKFHDGVPRGAQTWECPLHTPDILASAQMVRAYTLGYEVSGEAHFLEEARYWAWTGVPFVYLVAPTDQAVGLYATIPVFGATYWQAPVWLGLPVQWCGLVYADALYRLRRADPKGPWKQIADGITVSGIQQCWTQTNADYQGLLPDSFVLRAQKRNGPAINPATLESCASQYFSGPVYDFRAFRASGLLVHAPGEIADPEESMDHVRFRVKSWVSHPYFVLINGLTRKPRLRINDQSVECVEPHQFVEKSGRLILKLEGQAVVDLAL